MKFYTKILFILIFFIPLLVQPQNLPKINIGGEIRVRAYDLQNIWDFNHKTDSDYWSVLRNRTSIHLTAEMENHISGFIKITNQNYGEGITRQKVDQWEEDNKSNKIFMDNVYININKIFELPINLRFGRQNLVYGSGFVLFDGQSQFASTSAYFDGIKLTYDISEKVTVDLLYFKDEENSLDNKSNDDITLSGLYMSNKIQVLGDNQHFYLLNRNDENLNKNIFMCGLRFTNQFDFGLDYSLEGAWQTGDFSDSLKQNALGSKMELGYKLNKVFAQPRFFIGYVYLSGDKNGSSDKNEAWDVFYGGWPQFGDILAWKFINLGTINNISQYDPNYNCGSSTGGEVVYSNFKMLTLGIHTIPFEKFSTKFSLSQIYINQTMGNLKNDFGRVFQWKTNFAYSKYLNFALYASLISPGDTFGDQADPASEIFIEAKLKF